MYVKFYLLKTFVLEEIYPWKLPKFFQDVRRDKNMDRSTKIAETSKKKNWRDNNRIQNTLKAAATNTENKSEEVDDSKSLLSDLTFTFGDAPDRVQSHSM